MRQVELKTITESTLDPRTGKPVETTFSYRENILNALRYPQGQQQGLDYAEMAKVIPLIQRLQKAKDGESILFEEADHAVIVERVKGLRWLVAAETAFDFVTYIKDRPEAPVTPTVSKKRPTL